MVPVDDDDADTTAATTAPALGPAAAAHGADADDSTVQQLPSEQVLAAEARAGSAPDDLSRETSPTTRGPQTLARGPARRPMMTLLGTGPARNEPEDEEHESVTERAKLGVRLTPYTAEGKAIVRVPAPVRPPLRPSSVSTPALPLPAPGGAAPTPVATPAVLPELPGPRGSQPEADDDDVDETEVRTVVEQVATAPRVLGSAKAEAALPPLGPPQDAEQDSVTARAPAVRMPSFARMPVVTEKADTPRQPSPSLLDPPTSPRAVAPNVAGPLDPPTAPVPAPKAPPPRPPAETQAAPEDLYDPEESVTTRGPAVDDLPGDVTEGTTKKLQGVAALPSEDEPESVTTQAPGHLTNMLRVIAAETPQATPAVAPGEDDEDEDEALPENRTAVMPNRPYAMSSRSVPVASPASVSVRGGAPGPSPVHPHLALTGRDHGSESALRVAEPARAPVDQASLGAIAVGPRGAHDAVLAPPFVPAGGEVGTAPVSRAPRYGAVVALVALVSLGLPVGVFYVLRGRTEEVAPGPRDVRTPTAEVVKRDDPTRAKAPPKASATGGKRR